MQGDRTSGGGVMRGIHHIGVPCPTIRRLVTLWTASVLVAWAGLVTGWLAVRVKLSQLTHDLLLDVRALDMTRELELAILAGTRAGLLWLATGDSLYQERRDAHQATAEQIAAGFDPYITSRAEYESLADVRTKLSILRDRRASPTPVPLEIISQAADDLLSSVNQLHARNKEQMEQSVTTAERMYTIVSYCALGLSAGTAALLLLGSLGIIQRVVRPVLALTDTAGAFGRGDFAARTPVLHEDELGALTRTFNNMADDIAGREDERLRFVAMVVHDLKNPVLAIEMAARTLHRCPQDERVCRFYLDAIQVEVKRLRMIIRDLTDDIQVASGRFAVEKTPVDLAALVRRLLETQATVFADHQIALETQEATVLGDECRLERVVMNLVSNAVKYSPPGTHVTIRVERKESLAWLSVADQGSGISKEDLPVLFQPFGRGRSAEAFAEGTGMGLYVVKRIVAAHGGSIEVHSEPGHGATFLVKLPLTSESRNRG